MAGGQQVDVGQGSLSQAVTPTGAESTVGQGDLADGRLIQLRSRKLVSGSASFALSGAQASAGQGALGKTRTRSLTGIALAVPQGFLTLQGGNGTPQLVSQIADFDLARGATDSIATDFTHTSGSPMTFALASGSLPSGVTLRNDGLLSATSTATLGQSGDLVVYADDGNGDIVTTFALSTTAVSGTYPFVLGVGFKKGDVPDTVCLDIPTAQVDVKRRWGDGSAKHVVVSGRAALTQNVARTMSVIRGHAAPGTALGASDIQTAAPSASVQCGAFGTVTLASLFAAPTRTWVSGPEMVECHYRANVGTSLMATEWRVRLFADGRLWIRVWVENGYLDNGAGAVSGVVDRSYVPTVTISGVTIYNNAGAVLSHYKHTRWKAEGWIGGDPALKVTPNVTYLRQTKLVPNYHWSAPQAATLNGFAQTYTPMGIGDLTAYMPDFGYQPQIGIIPLWEAMCAATGDARAVGACIANGFHLNSYTICWRDFTTKLPIKPSVFPDWSVSGNLVGGDSDLSVAGANHWDGAHHPSEGYLAYVLTGDYDHLETLALQSSTLFLFYSPESGLPNGTARILGAQDRTKAWIARTFGQYAAIAPDGDAVAAEYRTLLASQYTYWKAKIDRPGASQIGYPVVTGTQNNAAPLTQAAFMYHFWMQANGHVWDIEPGLTDVTNLQALRDFMYKGAVGILGPNGASNYCFTKASAVYLNLSDLVVANFAETQPEDLYQTWGEIYEHTHGAPNTSCANTLEGSSGGNLINGATGYWGNLMSAIAFAVDHGASGAQASWDRLTGATNWATLRDQGNFDDVPQFGIVPRNWSG